MNSLKKIFYFHSQLIFYGMFITILNFFLIQLPLIGTLGYEFAAVNGILFFLLSGIYLINFSSKPDYTFKKYLLNLFILSLIPFLISVIKSLLTMFCSFIDGLFFYLLIVCTSIIFGILISTIINFGTQRFKMILFIGIFIFTCLIPVLEIYFLPQVYFFSPLIGFFPGNIYDEGLSPDLKLFFHQFIVIVFSFAVIYILLNKKDFIELHKKKFISSFILAIIIFQFISPYFGFTTTFSKLESVLPNKIQSENLTLHYDKIDSSEAKFISLNQEFYFEELVAMLKTKPSKMIDVYLFNNREQKKKYFGAGNADVAKPWQYSVYISEDGWENTLKHELVHIFSAEFGTGIFQLASGFNAALIEGMAVSVEGISNDISIKDLSALAFNNGYRVNISSLFSGLNFFKSNSGLGYLYSGAFISYLTNKFGIEKVKAFYFDGEFENVFGSNLKTEQKNFEMTISRSEYYGTKAMADYDFGRLTILQKICPRFIADRLNTAFKKLSDNQLREAEELFLEVNKKTLNYPALVGLSEIYLRQNRKQQAIQIIKSDFIKFTGTPYYYNLIFRLGDLYAANQQNDSSIFWFNKLVIENPNHQLKYLSQTRLSLLEVNKLQEYLDGNDSLKLKILIEFNSDKYDYNSLPILIDLLGSQKYNYNASLNIFNKSFIVDDSESSYAAYKLSQYMLENFDYINARKYAALSLRVKEGNLFYLAMQKHFNKTNWFYKNADKVSTKFLFVSKN